VSHENAGDLRKLGKDFTEQDHVVRVGRPQNSLVRNYYYSIEKDLNCIAERTTNTNVGVVNLAKGQRAVDEQEG
jgi:hypothetical protein